MSLSSFESQDDLRCETAMSLLFGEETSLGQVCSVAKAVGSSNVERMPGSCCLDTPLDRNGIEYQCSSSCINNGPWLSGFSPGACKNVGGTWCRAACKTLQTCVNDRTNTTAAFESYAEELTITDPHDENQCEDAREFMGYPRDSIDDNAICRTFHSLKCDPFFDLTNPLAQDQENLEYAFDDFVWGGFPEQDPLTFKQPKRADLADTPGVNPSIKVYKAIRSSLSLVTLIHQKLDDKFGAVEAFECLSDATEQSGNICKVAKNLVSGKWAVLRDVALIAKQAIEKLYDRYALKEYHLWQTHYAATTADRNIRIMHEAIYENQVVTNDNVNVQHTELRRDLGEQHYIIGDFFTYLFNTLQDQHEMILEAFGTTVTRIADTTGNSLPNPDDKRASSFNESLSVLSDTLTSLKNTTSNYTMHVDASGKPLTIVSLYEALLNTSASIEDTITKLTDFVTPDGTRVAQTPPPQVEKVSLGEAVGGVHALNLDAHHTMTSSKGKSTVAEFAVLSTSYGVDCNCDFVRVEALYRDKDGVSGLYVVDDYEVITHRIGLHYVTIKIDESDDLWKNNDAIMFYLTAATKVADGKMLQATAAVTPST